MNKMREAEQRRIHETRKKRRRKRRRQQMIARGMVFIILLLLIGAAAVGIHRIIKSKTTREVIVAADEMKYVTEQPDYMVKLLEVNEYSRPGTVLENVNGIVVHYTANPGTTAEQNRSYFANLAETGDTYASSHFVIGIGGEIIQCIPCNEIAYASNDRNSDTIAIECCIPDETGRFDDATYDSLIKLVTWLMGRYELSIDDVIRHYDVTGKACPKFYVENQWAWDQFKEDLLTYIDTYGVAKTEEIQ